jgi:hypothetical protein
MGVKPVVNPPTPSCRISKRSPAPENWPGHRGAVRWRVLSSKKEKKTKTTRRRAGHPQLRAVWGSSANATTTASLETRVRNKTTPDIATSRRKRRAVGGDRWNKCSARAFEKQRRKMPEERYIRPRDKNDVRDKRKMPERREQRPREEKDDRRGKKDV